MADAQTGSSTLGRVLSPEEQAKELLGLRNTQAIASGNSPEESTKEALAANQQLSALNPKQELIINGRKIPVEKLKEILDSYVKIYGETSELSVKNDADAMAKKLAFLDYMKRTNYDLDAVPTKAVAGIVGFVSIIGFCAKALGADDIAESCEKIVNDWRSSNDIYTTTTQYDDLKGHLAPNVNAAVSILDQGKKNVMEITNNDLPGVISSALGGIDKSMGGIASGVNLNLGAKKPDPKPSVAAKEVHDPTKWFAENAASLGIRPETSKVISDAFQKSSGADGKLQANELADFRSNAALTQMPADQRSKLYAKMSQDGLLELAGPAPRPK
jgi:hypothetical protein